MFYPKVRAVPVALAAFATLPDAYAVYVPRQDTTTDTSQQTTSENDHQTTSTEDNTSTSADDNTSTATGTRTRTTSATTTGESSTQTTSSDSSTSTSDSASSTITSSSTTSSDSSSSSSKHHSSTSSSTSASASATESSESSSGSGGLSVGAIVGIAIAGLVVGGLIFMMLTAWARRRHKAAKRPATMVFDPNFFAGSKAGESVPLTSQTTEQGELARYSDKAETPGTAATASTSHDLYPPAPPHATYTNSSAAYSYSDASLSGPPLQHADAAPLHAPTPINPAMAAPIAFSRASTPTTSGRTASPAGHVGSPPFAPRLDSPHFEGLGVLPALQPGSRDSSVGPQSSRADMGDMFFTTPPMSPTLGGPSATRPLEPEHASHQSRESDDFSASHEGEQSTSSHLPYPGDAPGRGRQ
ncbi:hypothetical protein EV122DRAFT_260275 [Schizophyllum commune]